MRVIDPPEAEYDFTKKAVRFRAEGDRGESIPCWITAEALRDKFGAESLDEADLLLAFLENWPVIHAYAMDHFTRQPSVPLLIRSGNL